MENNVDFFNDIPSNSGLRNRVCHSINKLKKDNRLDL